MQNKLLSNQSLKKEGYLSLSNLCDEYVVILKDNSSIKISKEGFVSISESINNVDFIRIKDQLLNKYEIRSINPVKPEINYKVWDNKPDPNEKVLSQEEIADMAAKSKPYQEMKQKLLNRKKLND